MPEFSHAENAGYAEPSCWSADGPSVFLLSYACCFSAVNPSLTALRECFNPDGFPRVPVFLGFKDG